MTDRTAIVTGASRGLGRAIALRLARDGMFVFVGFERRADDAAETVALVEQQGGAAAALQLDVRDAGAVGNAFDAVLAQRPGVDVLVNNAAVTRDGMFALLEAEAWQEVLDVGLTGTFNCCRAVARVMMRQRSGVIVNIGSVSGHRGNPGQTNYSAAKGGVVAFTRTLAMELAPRNIRVNAVVPGVLSTGMGARLERNRARDVAARVPLGRLGTGDEVANVVAFLASEQASYLIGQAIIVDGGLTL